MASYTVGSLASLISQKPQEKKKNKSKTSKEETLENSVDLESLFNSAPAPAAIHVPIASAPQPEAEGDGEQTENKKKRKKGASSDEYVIDVLKTKKKKNDEEVEDDPLDSLLELPAEGSDDEDGEDTESKKDGVKLTQKQRENDNLKKLETKTKKKAKEEDADKSKGVVFVKNLPIKVQRKAVKYLFKKFGKIQSVWLRCAAIPDPTMPKKVAIIKKEFHPERASISAYVRFEDPASAESALAMNGFLYEGHHLAVSLEGEKHKRDSGKAIFVGNLPFNIEDETLWTFFQDCGKIVDVRVIRDRATGQGKGFGYVNFESSDAVELALKLDGSAVSGREVRIQRCSKKPKQTESKFSKKGAEVPDKAFRRLKEKKATEARQKKKKDQTWTAALRKKSENKAEKPAFAGEAATENGKEVKVKRPAKAAKKNKAELQKQMIAKKLTNV